MRANRAFLPGFNRGSARQGIWLPVATAILFGVAVGVWLARIPEMREAGRDAGILEFNVDRAALSDIALTDHQSTALSWGDLAGQRRLVYFGYTYCPDICPTGLLTIQDALSSNPDRTSDILPVFVTVDPQRDTPEVLADYVSNFHQDLVGLTGRIDDIGRLAGAFKVLYGRSAGYEQDPHYLMDHSNFFYLVDANGSVLDALDGAITAAELSDRLAAIN